MYAKNSVFTKPIKKYTNMNNPKCVYYVAYVENQFFISQEREAVIQHEIKSSLRKINGNTRINGLICEELVTFIYNHHVGKSLALPDPK